MQERREEMRRRIEEERKRKAEAAGDPLEEEPEYVPFGMEPQEKAPNKLEASSVNSTDVDPT